MTTLQQLEDRLNFLEGLVKKMCDLNTANLVNEQMDDATVMAIYSIAQDLAVKAGVSSEVFLKHYQIRFRWWHDYFLQRAEDTNPALAAEIDPRSVSESAVEATYPEMDPKIRTVI